MENMAGDGFSVNLHPEAAVLSYIEAYVPECSTGIAVFQVLYFKYH